MCMFIVQLNCATAIIDQDQKTTYRNASTLWPYWFGTVAAAAVVLSPMLLFTFC